MTHLFTAVNARLRGVVGAVLPSLFLPNMQMQERGNDVHPGGKNEGHSCRVGGSSSF